MSFRRRQKFILAPCSAVMALEDVTLETGVIEQKACDLCAKELPEPSLFDLEDNIKAGVNLKEVSSIVIQPSSASFSDVVGKELKIEERSTEKKSSDDKE